MGSTAVLREKRADPHEEMGKRGVGRITRADSPRQAGGRRQETVTSPDFTNCGSLGYICSAWTRHEARRSKARHRNPPTDEESAGLSWAVASGRDHLLDGDSLAHAASLTRALLLLLRSAPWACMDRLG